MPTDEPLFGGSGGNNLTKTKKLCYHEANHCNSMKNKEYDVFLPASYKDKTHPVTKRENIDCRRVFDVFTNHGPWT